MSGNDAQTRVAIMAASEQDHSHLSTLLSNAGLNVVLQEVAGNDFIRQLEQTSADVLLVDLGDDASSEVDIIDTLLEYDSLPVFFNDSSKAGSETDVLWAKKLARRLQQLVQSFDTNNGGQPGMDLEAVPLLQDSLGTDVALEAKFDSTPEPGLETGVDHVPEIDHEVSRESSIAESLGNFEDGINDEIESISQQDDATVIAVKDTPLTFMPDGAAVNVWVLGASLGGPQAVRQFLMAIREDLPVAFILAQHIGENHISLLAEQLDRVSQFRVFPGYNGHMIRHHEVILAPAGKNIHITDDGYLSLSDQPENAIYSPCINDVMTAVAGRYGNMSGTIVFSGMGDDGAIGCQAMAEKGGIVWAQDVDSCVISSMPDQARKTNNVTFSANPRRLADELYKYYME